MFGHSFRVTDSWDEAPGASSGTLPIVLPATPSANIMMRFDAENGITDAGGGLVSAWTDQVNSEAITNAVSLEQPLLVSSVINGLPVVRFDGVNSNLWTETLSVPVQAHGRSGLSMFLVGKATVEPTGVGYMYGYHGDTSFQTINATLVRSLLRTDTTTSAENITFNANNGLPFLAMVTWKVNAPRYMRWASSTESVVSIKPGTPLITTPFSGTTVNAPPAGTFWIGARATSSFHTELWAGDIAEILIYDFGLDATDRDAVASYLNAKYAIGATI